MLCGSAFTCYANIVQCQLSVRQSATLLPISCKSVQPVPAWVEEPAQNGNLLSTLSQDVLSQHGKVVNRVLRLWRNTHWHYYASFDSLLSRAGVGHLGKGWIVRDTSTRRMRFFHPLKLKYISLIIIINNYTNR